MSLLRSSVASAVLIALTQASPAGLSLRELSRASRARDSSVQRAVEVLAEEGIVERHDGPAGARYALGQHPLQRELLTLGLHDTSRMATLETLSLANPAVEFAAVDARGLLVVFRQRSTADERLRLRGALDLLRPPVALTSFEHDALAERLLEEPELRARAARSTILAGSVARSFPDRRRHGDPRRARALGRPHPSLRLPSQRALQRIAKRFRLDEMRLFGSAVRSDFRADSDLDVLVRPRPGARLGIFDLIALEDELEGLFDRDVDLVTPDALGESVRPRVEREAVVLCG